MQTPLDYVRAQGVPMCEHPSRTVWMRAGEPHCLTTAKWKLRGMDGPDRLPYGVPWHVCDKHLPLSVEEDFNT